MPEELYKLLAEQYGTDIANEIGKVQEKPKKVTLRVNNIKSNIEEIKKELEKEKIDFKEVSWYKDALIIENVREDTIKVLDIYNDGKIYMQSLSSMLPVLFLEPEKGENILDMAAAPGGKTTQIASITKNQAYITAVEKNKIRGEKLKYNLNKQGVTCASVLLQDARNLSDYFSFDKILLDSPCSGSGTLSINNEKDIKGLVERSCKVQEILLKKALNLLKSGHEMIYSTCSILKNENEDIINKLLKSKKAEVVKIAKIPEIEYLPSKIEHCICVKPSELFEGFFVAKLRKI